MLRILFRLWPVLIPALIFFIWYVRARHQLDIKLIDTFQEKVKRYRYYALVSTAVIFLVCSVVYVLTRDANVDKQYVPAHIDNGKLVPAGFENK